MKEKVRVYFQELLDRYPQLKEICQDIWAAYCVMEKCYESDGKLLIAGNGGSSADADHMVGELMKSFKIQRRIDDGFARAIKGIDSSRGNELMQQLQGALPAIALHNHSALFTACQNDVNGVVCFAQQVYGYGRKEDVYLGITTSGNSENVVYAAIVAKAKGMPVIELTGKDAGIMSQYADVIVRVPCEETYKIQELHLPIYHCWCMMLEASFFSSC